MLFAWLGAAPEARVHAPGAAFIAAALLAWSCLAIYGLTTREPALRALESGAIASES